jgi:HlyD family secretion protein
MKRTLFITGLLVVAAAVTAFVIRRNGHSDEEARPHVEVTRGSIVDRALAVGTIEPRVEIEVKSQVSGVVKRQFAEAGEFVRAGDPLLELQPNPTPRELMEAERQIEQRELELQNLKDEYERTKGLYDKQLIAVHEYERVKRTYDEALLAVRTAKEQLTLLREGKVNTRSGSVETVVRAPVSGFVLDKMVEIGDPVVPLTSYQEGTVLMTMADMDDLIFRGTVDEIDVGRLKEGMTASIKVGALPGAEVSGELARIWLKARKEENSTVFPVEVEIRSAVERDPDDTEAEPVPVVLRAGYSANTEIVIESREDVLLVPERVVHFNGDSTLVEILLDDNTTEERLIRTGLSDAINVEIVSGLDEGMKIAEKPPKVIV